MKKQKMSLSIKIWKEDGRWYVKLIKFNVCGSGKTIDKAFRDFIEAMDVYFHGENIDKLIKQRL